MKKNKEIRIDNILLNKISSMRLEIKRNNIILGENAGKVYGIVKYHHDLEYSWLSKTTNIPGAICSITFTQIDNVYCNQSDSRWKDIDYGKIGTIDKSECG